MDTKIIIIIASIVTLASIILKFSKLAMENVSIFLDIRKKTIELRQMISQAQKTGAPVSNDRERRTISISDWFSIVALIVVSYKLWGEYTSLEPLTREIVFNIGMLFSLAVFNVLSLAISKLERRLGTWVDNFLTALEETLAYIQIVDANTLNQGNTRKTTND